MFRTPSIPFLMFMAAVATSTSPRGIATVLVCPFALPVAAVAIRRTVVAAGTLVVSHGRVRVLGNLLQRLKQLGMEW
jgi:hypothetical protein